MDEPVEDDETTESAVAPQPLTVPQHHGADLDPVLRQTLHELLLSEAGQLGQVYRAMVEHPGAGPSELLPYTTCANAGVVANRRVVVRAVLDGITAFAPSVALQAARSVRTLMKRTTDLTVVGHLESVLDDLRGRADSEDAVAAEDVELKAGSEELSKTLAAASGVYVYTYPHYWRHPYLAGSERRLLKVGRTGGKAWSRVLSQARRTGMPEDPVLLRVYETDDPTTVEHHFHVLLDAAEHQRSQGVAVGTEWFVTTIDFCDAVASVLGMTTLKAPGLDLV